MALDKTFAAGEILSAANVNGYLLSMWIPIDKRVITSGSAAASVSFQSLDSNFRVFRLTASVVTTGSGTEVGLRFNNDSGNNYAHHRLYGSTSGGTPSGTATTSTNLVNLGIGATAHHHISYTIAKYGTADIGAVTGHTASVFTNGAQNVLTAGEWNNTSALINRIDILAHNGGVNFFGVFALEGIRGV
ncbi:unnamed protein product [[Actinomadura] parvosata subsp. kistnae]|uniref:Uncharacterized protein n=1 Tax=[Actinomadura] parvosata subsp. kistnae TaxID=1909395 RepID=A0A1V0ABQ6_9ACTN|nr:hypothetical protein [Nonomuraea sp. ATCC 55076]AQZ67644.1 hypothetical protein BKM31_44805 [Nonomuraea sp. ATCC 55076]SPL94069.1 unnamed protein product [Actinomadura parvosata subsp. kistnae]